MASLVYGLQDLESYRESTLEQVGIRNVAEMVSQFTTIYNRVVDTWLGTVAQRNAEWNLLPINRYWLPAVPTLQDVDEFGVSTPLQSVEYYDMGLPLFEGEFSVGYTATSARVRTVEQLNTDLRNMQTADRKWMQRRALETLFTNTSWTFLSKKEDKRFPAEIPIFPLANGDSRSFVDKTGAVITSRQHYLAQSAAIADANDPFPTIRDLLDKYAGATGRYVVFIPTNLKAATRALSAFYSLPETSFVNRPITEATVSDQIQSLLLWGDRVLGEHDAGITIVEWEQLPSGYMFAMDAGRSPLGIRERIEEPLRGMLNMNYQEHFGNEVGSRWKRILGMGVVDPTAGVIYRVGNASYAIPTGYAIRH